MANSGGSVKPGSNRDINRGIAYNYGKGEALAGHKNRQFMAQQLKAMRKIAKGKIPAAPSSREQHAKTLKGYLAGMKQRPSGPGGKGGRHRPAGSPRGGQFF